MLSVTQAVGDAFERMRVILFRPFDLKKWLVLGFCAFLAGLTEGKGGGSGNRWNSGGNRGGGPRPSQIVEFAQENLAVILVVGISILVVLLLLGVLFTWLSSRGKFMFLEGVATNRAAVKEPWRRHRELGNSLFVVIYPLSLVMMVLAFGIVALAIFIAWPDTWPSVLACSRA
jgi:hypothetical protein